MRRFRFTLDPALRLRQQLEEQAQLALASQQRRLEQEQTTEAELRLALSNHQSRRTELQRQAIEIHALTAADRYSETLLRSLAEQEERVRAAALAVESCRATLKAKRMDREALEQLREKRLAEHIAEAQRGEQREMDETSVLRWRREA